MAIRVNDKVIASEDIDKIDPHDVLKPIPKVSYDELARMERESLVRQLNS